MGVDLNVSKRFIHPRLNELSVPEIGGSSTLYREVGIVQPEISEILEVTTATPVPQGKFINPPPSPHSTPSCAYELIGRFILYLLVCLNLNLPVLFV